jgi:hypothetical protein
VFVSARILQSLVYTCAFSSQPSQQSVIQSTAVSDKAAKTSQQKSKCTLPQNNSVDAALSKQPPAAEESFYTGRGAQPRKTIDGLPVFSLSEMVLFNCRFHLIAS